MFVYNFGLREDGSERWGVCVSLHVLLFFAFKAYPLILFNRVYLSGVFSNFRVAIFEYKICLCVCIFCMPENKTRN